MKSWRLRLCSAVFVELTPRERLLRLGATALPDAALGLEL
jgi:DNA repair protein RadC